MLRLLTIWLDLCLLRAGPQDLPVSRVLLGLTLFSYTLVSLLISVPGYPVGKAMQVALVDVGLVSGFAFSLLYLLGKMARFNQTLTALAGTGALLGLIAWPLVQALVGTEDPEQVSLLVSVLWLLLYGWSLVVIAHIMRHALEVPFPVAIGIAILYTLVAMQVVGSLFPVDVT